LKKNESKRIVVKCMISGPFRLRVSKSSQENHFKLWVTMLHINSISLQKIDSARPSWLPQIF